MKFLPAALLLAFAGSAAADLPKPAPVTRYSQLWVDSPFTTKPPPAEAAPEANPLEDYALGGVSPVSGGYRITLLNRKNPEERIVIPDNPDFKILGVQYSPGNPLGTTVRLSTGSKTGTVSFDEKLLVLKAAPAPAPQPQNAPPGTTPQPPVPGQPQQAAEAVRQPRPRVVTPPPQPGANGAAAPQPVQQNRPQGQIQRQQRVNRR